MKPTIIEDEIFEFEPFEKDGSGLLAAEASWRGMAEELQELHYLKGASFIKQLKLIVYYGEFRLVEGETDIYSAISEKSDDFDNLINAVRKAVEHGYRVYILPNPKGIRTADFIFERKGVYKMFVSSAPLSAAILNNKRATRSDSLFVNGVVSIKSCSHAETYRIAKTNVLTMQR